MQKLKTFSEKFPILQKISQKTNNKLKPEHQLIILGLTLFLFISLTPIGPLLTTIISVILPLKQTLLTLKNINLKNNLNNDSVKIINPNNDMKMHPSNLKKQLNHELKKLLIFWLSAFFFICIDAYFYFLVLYVPFYCELKMILLFYIFSYTDYVYDNVISRIPDCWFYFVDDKTNFENEFRVAAEAARNVLKRVDDKKS
ncbi:hypothetical protein DMUE_1491 [Dictyocoela muelleri]|nr:hypothetical protein DMUE_1491 [Dictyocoela muelleri]